MAGLEQNSAPGQPNMIERTSYATKKFMLEGVTFYTDEFSADSDTMGNSSHQETNNIEPDSSDDAQMNETLILCGKLYGRHEISIHMKLSDVVLGPKAIYQSKLSRPSSNSYNYRLNWILYLGHQFSFFHRGNFIPLHF